MAKKIGVGYSFREKSLEKENEILKAKIEKLETVDKKVKIEATNKKAEDKRAKAE